MAKNDLQYGGAINACQTYRFLHPVASDGLIIIIVFLSCAIYKTLDVELNVSFTHGLRVIQGH